MEQRHFKRVRFFSQAELVSDGHRYATEVIDLSLKGALIKKPAETVSTGTSPLLLSLHLSESEETITMQVSIAHQHADVLGLHCDKIDIDSISHLRRLLELNLGDPALLNRELDELINL
ncbi:PilZ domain-containing protein [Alishewanella tabrizica]|uniref:Cyclic diguanosine monophosphate-binding protein n=1 Tax=Alishewanella tabrizica TaxID=671278 RepID=A0ABQ2WGG9_9ALTE|nr:PilZ domain-containing protein [Alishewanella tabrizica]GGW53617.1 cyclic diguanosine monophosphate-binding protein [Alishewanella tabrizica]